MIARRRRRTRLDPASLRLPLIALIDVVLFLLMYFLLAGSLAAEERQLATTLRTGGAQAPATRDLVPQILRVEVDRDRAVFRIGERVFPDRDSLADALRPLPKEVGIVVRVANEAPVASAATAIQVCRDVGFNRISYAAVP